MASYLNGSHEDLSPDDYDDNDNEEEEGGHKKRKQVKRACYACRKAHARCDEERPCRRCIRTGVEATCVDVPRKKRVLTKKEEAMKRPSGAKRGRPRRKLDENGEGSESGGESDSRNFYFDPTDAEVLEGGSVGGKTTPHPSTTTTTSAGKSVPSSSSFHGGNRKNGSGDLKLSWKDSLIGSIGFAHNEDDDYNGDDEDGDGDGDDAKESAMSVGGCTKHEEEREFTFDLGKSSDDERCLEEIPQEMVRELTELRSYNSSLQDMIKDVQRFNSYQRKKRRQWELDKISSGSTGSSSSSSTAAAASAVVSGAAPSDALPQWLSGDFPALSNKTGDLSADIQSSSSSAPVTQSISTTTRLFDDGEAADYIGSWSQTATPATHAPMSLQLPAQLAVPPQQFSNNVQNGLQANPSGQQPQQATSSGPQTGPAPFTTSLPFSEV